MASEGALLTSDGRQRASGLFIEPGPALQNSNITVISNRYWVEHASVEGDKVEVAVESGLVGRIDSTLH